MFKTVLGPSLVNVSVALISGIILKRVSSCLICAVDLLQVTKCSNKRCCSLKSDDTRKNRKCKTKHLYQPAVELPVLGRSTSGPPVEDQKFCDEVVCTL